MKFCWHDWYTHKKGPQSGIAYAMGNPDICIPWSMMVIGGLVTAAIMLGFSFWYGLVIGLIAWISMAYLCYRMDVHDFDPWQLNDRTCLKCDKIEFHCSNREKENDARKAKQVTADKFHNEETNTTN